MEGHKFAEKKNNCSFQNKLQTLKSLPVPQVDLKHLLIRLPVYRRGTALDVNDFSFSRLIEPCGTHSTGTFAFILAAHLLFMFLFYFLLGLACLSVSTIWLAYFGGGHYHRVHCPAVAVDLPLIQLFVQARPQRPAAALLPLSPISLPNPTLPSGALERSAGSVQFCRSAPHWNSI